MKITINVLVCLFLLVLAPGCVSSRSGRVYSRAETLVAQQVKLGTVETVQPVRIEGTRSQIGPLAGGALGALGGSRVGGGKGSVAAAIGGGLLGGLLGGVFEEGATRCSGLEITVLLEDGKRISVVQEADEAFAPGDHVKVLSSHRSTRVTHQR